MTQPQQVAKAEALRRSGDVKGAETIFRALLSSDPDDPAAKRGLAETIWAARRGGQEAASLLRQVLDQRPDDAQALRALARIQSAEGDFHGAVASARRSIELEPGHVGAFPTLVEAQKMKPGDPAFAQMEAVLAAPHLTAAARRDVHFALGKSYNDIDDTGRAFAHYQCANDFVDARYNPDGVLRAALETTATINAPLLKKLHGKGARDDRMVFVLGMPRSGTTLVERILAAHPEVCGGGERTEFGAVVNALTKPAVAKNPKLAKMEALARSLSPALLQSAGKGYLDAVTAALQPGDARRIVDKMPENYWYAGLIALVFPNARLIHVRRHPMDVCLSCFQQNFLDGHHYATAMGTLGAHYRTYHLIMAHWREVLGDRLLDLRYEDLVQTPEETARRLVAFTGLDWNDACAAPEKTDGLIRTVSRWQARQKVYTSSVEKWRRYEAHLTPLILSLGGMDWVDKAAR